MREESLRFLRNAFLVANALSVLSMTLAIGGVFGLQSFAAVRRRREFGIRLALGARPPHLVRLMFADAAKAVLAGVLIAAPVVFAFSRLLGAVVPGVEGIDASISLGVLAVLLAVAIAGSAWPTVQSLRNHPLTSIRDA
jgi:ABC-type antimicrobial peptide transport system permease subunit